MNNMDEDANILSRLLEEDRNSIKIKLVKYESEDRHMRMQLMLRDYFREEKSQLEPRIIEEAQSISVVFPNVPIEIIQEMLKEIGDQTDRSRIVIKKLSTRQAATKLHIGTKVDDNGNELVNKEKPLQIKVKTEPTYSSCMVTQPSTSSFTEPPSGVNQVHKFDKELFERALEVFPDACPSYLSSLCARKDFSDIVLAEIVQTLLEGNYPKRYE